MVEDEGTTTKVEIEHPQVWELEIDGRLHRVETSTGGWTNKVAWSVDGELVAAKTSGLDDSLELEAPKDHPLAEELGAVKARFTRFGRTRRVTHFGGERDEAMTRALVGTGGTDLDPEPGSKAARREEWAVRHPVLAALDDLGAGVWAVLVPVVLAAVMPILRRLLPDWDLPHIDLPSIPWPDIDLPSIPWPDWDLPSIPWPDVELPGWVGEIFHLLKLLWPVILGAVIAWSEHQRRRRAAAARAERRAAREESADVPSPQGDEGGATEEHRDEEGEGQGERVPLPAGDLRDVREGGERHHPFGQAEEGTDLGEREDRCVEGPRDPGAVREEGDDERGPGDADQRRGGPRETGEAQRAHPSPDVTGDRTRREAHDEARDKEEGDHTEDSDGEVGGGPAQP